MSILGNRFLNSATGELVDSAALKGKVVGIYFSAHWCPPCRSFTPQLAQFYEYQKMMSMSRGEDDCSLEIVFASSDSDKSSFEEYFAEMPWLAIPFEDRFLKEELSKTYSVSGIPTLVFLAPDGSVLTTDGRSKVMEDESGAFLHAWHLCRSLFLPEEAPSKPPTPPALQRQISDEGKALFAHAMRGSDADLAERVLAEMRGSSATKTITLKTLATLVGNLANNPSEPKFQTIRLSNPKIEARLCSTPQAVPFLKAMGFVETEGVLSITESNIDSGVFAQMHRSLNEAVEIRTASTGTTVRPAPGARKPARAPTLSLKQQARRDAAEREKRALVEAKAERERQLAAIRADKHVRLHDPNWKPGVSAAAGKSGSGIETFRDKFGEDQGG